MSFKVPAPELDRVIQNVLLYADPKAMKLNEILFVFSGAQLRVYSCDDYVTVCDSLTTDLGLDYVFSLKIEDVDKLGDWIKQDKKVVHKYSITLQKKMTGMLFECEDTSTDDESDNIFLSEIIPSEAWDLVFQLLDEDAERRMIGNFAIRPERLTKLARLKADKEAPIDQRGVDINGYLIIQFRKGSTLRGAIMPVTREKVKEEFLWPNRSFNTEA